MELVLGVGTLECLEGVDGVGRTGLVKLEVGHVELVIPLSGKPCQLQPAMVIEQVVMLLQRILGCDKKPHGIQTAKLTEVVRQCQVANVYGVERATEDADFPGERVHQRFFRFLAPRRFTT